MNGKVVAKMLLKTLILAGELAQSAWIMLILAKKTKRHIKQHRKLGGK